MKNHVIIVPIFKVRLFGWPERVDLTPAQAVVLRKLAAGGHLIGKRQHKVIVSLVFKGLLAPETNIVTSLGKEVAEALIKDAV